MTRGHLLVTGFGPFPGMPRNPSETLARQVGRLGRNGIAGFPVRPATDVSTPVRVYP